MNLGHANDWAKTTGSEVDEANKHRQPRRKNVAHADYSASLAANSD